MASQAQHEPGGVLPVARFSSARQHADDRYDEWKSGSLLSFGRMFDTEPLVSFGAETATAQLGEVGFSHTRMTSQNWRRTAKHVQADGADPLMVSIRFAGAGRGDANGKSFEAPAGSVVLSDFAQPQSYFAETSFNAVLSIPRKIAEQRMPRVRDLHGLVVPPQAAVLLRSHSLALIRALKAGVPAQHAERLGTVALDLLELGVAQSVENAGVCASAGYTGARFAAEAVIERHLSAPTLSVADVCRLAGVSRSRLYRLFEPDGGVLAYIRHRRTARIAEELRSGTRETIAAIAFRLGFADASHLTRTFRAEFGLPPSAYRSRYR